MSPSIIKSILMFVEEGFQTLMAHALDGQSPFTLSALDVIERCERVAQ